MSTEKLITSCSVYVCRTYSCVQTCSSHRVAVWWCHFLSECVNLREAVLEAVAWGFKGPVRPAGTMQQVRWSLSAADLYKSRGLHASIFGQQWSWTLPGMYVYLYFVDIHNHRCLLLSVCVVRVLVHGVCVWGGGVNYCNEVHWHQPISRTF